MAGADSVILQEDNYIQCVMSAYDAVSLRWY